MALDETIYEHFRGNDTITVTAAEQWSITMCKKLKKKYPDQVDIDYVNKDGSMVVHLPFEWMRIVPKRKDTISDEERAKRSAHMKELRQSQLSKAAITKNTPISAETV